MLGHGAYARDATKPGEHSAATAAVPQQRPKLTTITESNPSIQSPVSRGSPFQRQTKSKTANADPRRFVRCSKVLLKEKTDSFVLQDLEMFLVVSRPSASTTWTWECRMSTYVEKTEFWLVKSMLHVCFAICRRDRTVCFTATFMILIRCLLYFTTVN